jgi:hypothetical protein
MNNKKGKKIRQDGEELLKAKKENSKNDNNWWP